jgi:myosin I
MVSPPTFTVKHYAGAVTYHSDQFCEKNRDILNVDLIEMMKSSSLYELNHVYLDSYESYLCVHYSRPFVARLFPENTATMKSRPTTVGTKIRTQANLLVEKLMSCQPHCMSCYSTIYAYRLIFDCSRCSMYQTK